MIVIWWLLLVPIWSSTLRPKDSFTNHSKKYLSKPTASLLHKKSSTGDDAIKYSHWASNIPNVLDYAMYATPSLNPTNFFACVSLKTKNSFYFPDVSFNQIHIAIFNSLSSYSTSILFLALAVILNPQFHFTESAMIAGRMYDSLATVSRICMNYRAVFNDSPEKLEECHVKSAYRLYQLLAKQGGLYIKAGQHLAAMDYVLPSHYVKKLASLQDQATPMPIESVNSIFRNEFGLELDQVFSHFSPQPIGTASIGQVHYAILKDSGEKVAVKIQHPRVQVESASDLETLRLAGRVIEFFFPQFQTKHFVKQIQNAIKNELNFHKEACNAEWAAAVFEASQLRSQVLVPKIHRRLSSQRVLTMSFCPGIKIDDREALTRAGIDPERVDKLMYTVFSEMIFKAYRVHCDPHPGNLMIRRTDNGSIQLILLDHGLYHSIRPEMVKKLSEFWIALLLDGHEKIRELAIDCGFPDELASLVISGIKLVKEELIAGTPITEIVKSLEDSLLADIRADQKKILSEFLNSVPSDVLHIIKVYELLAANERRLLGSDVRNKPSLAITTKYALAQEQNILNYYFAKANLWYLRRLIQSSESKRSKSDQ